MKFDDFGNTKNIRGFLFTVEKILVALFKGWILCMYCNYPYMEGKLPKICNISCLGRAQSLRCMDRVS